MYSNVIKTTKIITIYSIITHKDIPHFQSKQQYNLTTNTHSRNESEIRMALKKITRKVNKAGICRLTKNNYCM